ncbi:putative bifunctional diguanylate cyclase/phosphodiesterase [Kineococcus glutinatus]|uniref:Diguanylate cyclase (GGDEF)-like protein n=1 Tax=Kineococcus glutinatus TaxID=1070872 RepID=A0ABP9HKK1_9ACTN
MASRVLDGALAALAAAVVVAAVAWFAVTADAGALPTAAAALLVGLVLIQLLTRFPLPLSLRHSGVEVQFDVGLLVFLGVLLPPPAALLVWILCRVPTSLLQRKRWSSRTFNATIGVLSGALALQVLRLLDPVCGDGGSGTLAEAVAVSAGIGVYLVADLLVSAVSVALAEQVPVHSELTRAGTAPAAATVVAVGHLGYLGAVVAEQLSPWFALLLLVPLLVTMTATRTMGESRAVARRNEALLAAATALHTLGRRDELERALRAHARMVVGTPLAALGHEPPGPGECGAAVVTGPGERLWLTAPQRRDPARRAGDARALEALASVGEAAFFRAGVTEEMHALARRDVVTGLPNRLLFSERLAAALQRAREGQRLDRLAVLYLDLDGFKAVNDRFGHDAGDELLRIVTGRLLDVLRGSTTVARLGGDEFGVLVPDCPDVARLCSRLLGALRADVRMRGHVVRVQGSLGVARAGAGDDEGTLLRNADTAMYRAKTAGKNRWVEFRPELLAEDLVRLQVIEDLQQALPRDFPVHYQPIVSLADGSLVGLEALVRWDRRPAGGARGAPAALVMPDVFVAHAEGSGTVVGIGDAVLRTVARDAAVLQEAAGHPLDLMVNVSPVQLRQPGFPARVASAVRAVGAGRLHLEVTESVLIDEESAEVLHELAATGARLSIDDFGTGFSSLGYLRQRPFSSFKVDRTFVRDIAADRRARALVEGMVKMGLALELDVVAEGVEDVEQAGILRAAGCPLAQGHLYCPPLSVAQLHGYLRGRRVPVLQD